MREKKVEVETGRTRHVNVLECRRVLADRQTKPHFFNLHQTYSVGRMDGQKYGIQARIQSLYSRSVSCENDPLRTF